MKLKYLICVLLVGSAFSIDAQTYNFRIYGEDERLPYPYVYNISQTPGGYLYLSTGEGLSFFDGNNFTTYISNEIASNLITQHFVDSRGNCWVAYLQNGMSYIHQGFFHALKDKESGEVKVTQFAEDPRQNIWAASAGKGIFMIDTSFRVRRSTCPEIENANCLIFDRGPDLLVGTSSGLYLVKTDTAGGVKLLCEVSELKGKNIKQIQPVNGNRNLFWLHVDGEGIYGIKRKGNCFRVFSHILPELLSDHPNIACIYCDKSKNLWVSLFGEGLRKLVFKGHLESNRYSVIKIDKSNGLKNVYIQSILEDFEGNMWFGTFGAGLIEKPVEKFSFYTTKDGIKNPNAKKIVVTRDGKIWIGSETGLNFFDPGNFKSIQYTKSNGFVNDEVSSLCQDSKGTLWIGTANKGIYTLDSSKKKFEDFSKKHKLPALAINAIIESQGEIIMATNEGLLIYDLNAFNLQFYTTANGLLHNDIINVFYDSRRRLWISSHGAPPYYISAYKVHVLKEIKELSSFNINAVAEDKNGNIWIATEGDGVFRYDSVCSNYRMKDGLASNYCYGICVDNNNAVWITHKNGLSEKKPLQREFHPVTGSEGLLFTENNLNAICKDGNGDLWFGTTEGIIHYNSETGKRRAMEPKLSILEIKMNEDTYVPGQVIDVQHGYYTARIAFLAISLTNPEKVKYKYRLLNIDSVWRYTDQRYVDYPNLSDGSYEFQVHACNGDGLWTKIPARIDFKIREPIWKKIWFYIFLLCLLVSVIYSIILWRTQSLKRSQSLLKVKVRQKTFLLQREKEAVEKIKVELENKNKDILDSIAYARRIQDSLLPPDETLSELFDENYFIFYRPKDIVSGDFYWAARVETGGEKSRTLSLAAVADCTGHGVPGAFLSIVASSFLKQSLAEKFVNNTGDVLDYLNKNITATLNQSSKIKNRINDGMDLSIIAIDYKLSLLHYAGANNPIYIFRKAENSTELFVLKPTKQAIGSTSGNVRNYDSQIFQLQAGDTVYMFSDGYPDQFGGEKDKKFNYRRFKSLLSMASEMPMSLQRAYLEERFEDWKGKTTQTDDVCIMGLKI